MRRFLFLVFLSIFFLHPLFSQVTNPTTSKKDTSKVVFFDADRLSYYKPDSVTEIQILAGNVRIKQGSTLIWCDSAIENKRTRIIEAFGHVHINDADSVNAWSQYLQYFQDTKIGILKKDVKLTDSKSTLYTEELQYDMNQKVGEYHTGGKLITDKTELTSVEGIYYEDLKDAWFRKNVKLTDPSYKLNTDTLLYNTETGVATFVALTHIEDSAKKSVSTREGYYDSKNRKAFFAKRPIIHDGTVTIIADSVNSNDSTGINILTGKAIYADTTQGVIVMGDHIIANRKEGTFRATEHPLMIIKQDKDSIYVTGDTLYSGKLSKLDSAQRIAAGDTIKGRFTVDMDNKEDSADRYFQAFHHVRVFSDSLQAVCDSLFYSGRDSAFRLFTNPIVWASNNQVTGDTIFLYTKNRKADRLFVNENGLAVSKSGENMYDQIKGNRLYGYFTDGAIDYMRSKGNAESVYYAKDNDGSLVGVNRASGDIIDIRFKDKEVKRVVFISDVNGTLFPIHQASEQDKLLKNFQWFEDKRPKTKEELIR